MITASEFLKWLAVFNVQYGGGVITLPVSMGQGGTGANLTPSEGSLFYSTDTQGALLPTAPNGVLVTDIDGLPSISSTLPAGLTIPDYLPLAGGTMTGDLFLAGMPTMDSMAATKQYVDDVAAGLAPTGPVDAGTTEPLAASTYFNGPANDGKGATITMNAAGIVIFDSTVQAALGRDYLIKDQADPVENGIYTCTTEPTVGVPGVFTRSITFDTPEAINKAGITPILGGATLEGQGWYEVNTVDNIGTDPIVFIRFGNDGTVTAITAGVGLLGGTITQSGTIDLDIPVTSIHGGTGLTTFAASSLLYASAADTWAALAAVNGGILGTSNTGVPTYIANPAAANRVLMSANGAISAWSTAQYLALTTANRLIYSSANNVLAEITTMNYGFLTTNGSGVPSLSSLANIQNLAYNYSADTGAANAYAVTLTPAVTSYVAGLLLPFKPANLNTDASTINANSVGAGALQWNGRPLSGGEVNPSGVNVALYDGANFQLLNSATALPPNRNFVIGGNFDQNLWQRGTSFPNQANAAGQYNADRFYCAVSGSGTGTVAQTADAPSWPTYPSGVICTNSMRFTVTTADSVIGAAEYYNFGYWFEGYDWAILGSGPFVIDFWVKATVTGIYCLSVNSGGADRAYIAEYTINASNTWEHKRITVPTAPTSGTWNYLSGRGAVVVWSIANGSNYYGTANIWQNGNLLSTSNQVNGVVNIGDIFALDLVQATPSNQYYPWLSRTNAQEALLQQRYYCKSYTSTTPPGTNPAGAGAIGITCTTNNDAAMSARFPNVMRTVPTVTLYSRLGASGQVTNYGTGVNSGTTVIASNIGNQGFLNITAASGIAAGTQYFAQFTADAEL